MWQWDSHPGVLRMIFFSFRLILLASKHFVNYLPVLVRSRNYLTNHSQQFSDLHKSQLLHSPILRTYFLIRFTKFRDYIVLKCNSSSFFSSSLPHGRWFYPASYHLTHFKSKRHRLATEAGFLWEKIYSYFCWRAIEVKSYFFWILLRSVVAKIYLFADKGRNWGSAGN